MLQMIFVPHFSMKKGSSYILKLPTEIHDVIKSFLPFRDQIRFFHCRKCKFGSRLIEGKMHVKDAFSKAVKNNKAAVVEHLLKCHPTFDPSFDDNWAILIASASGHVEVVKVLLADGRCDPSADNNFAIGWASFHGHIDVVKLLLADQRSDPSADDYFAIRWASSQGHVEVVKVLLADGRSDPSADDYFALIQASLNGHVEVVKILLADGRSDPSANNNLAIAVASSQECFDVVKVLLSDPRVDKWNIFYSAAESGQLYLMKSVLSDSSFDPSLNRNAAVKIAYRNGYKDIVDLLLSDPRVSSSIRSVKRIKL